MNVGLEGQVSQTYISPLDAVAVVYRTQNFGGIGARDVAAQRTTEHSNDRV